MNIMGKVGKWDLKDFFVLLGSIIGIVLAILSLFGVGIGLGIGLGFGLWWLWPIVTIILCLGMLGSIGVIKLFKLPTTAIALLIFGLIITILDSNWGGILIIIAAIIGFLGK